jgi:hypothetical protein
MSAFEWVHCRNSLLLDLQWKGSGTKKHNSIIGQVLPSHSKNLLSGHRPSFLLPSFMSLFTWTKVASALLAAAATGAIIYRQHDAAHQRAVLLARVLPKSLVIERALRDLKINQDRSNDYKHSARIQVQTRWLSSNVRIATTVNNVAAPYPSYLHHTIDLDAAATGALERLANAVIAYQFQCISSSASVSPALLHRYIDITVQRDVLDATGPDHVHTWVNKHNSVSLCW